MEPVEREGFVEAESQDSASEQVPVEAPPVEDEGLLNLEGLRFIPLNSELKRPSGASKNLKIKLKTGNDLFYFKILST